MKNTTKLEKLKQWLDENDISYEHRKNRRGQSDLWIRKYKIAVKIDGDDSQEFYRKHMRTTSPVFIRDTDTPKFVIEKVQNTIVNAMIKEQRRLEWLEKKEQSRRYYEECMKRHEEKVARKAAAKLEQERKNRRKRERIRRYEKVGPRRNT